MRSQHASGLDTIFIFQWSPAVVLATWNWSNILRFSSNTNHQHNVKEDTTCHNWESWCLVQHSIQLPQVFFSSSTAVFILCTPGLSFQNIHIVTNSTSVEYSTVTNLQYNVPCYTTVCSRFFSPDLLNKLLMTSQLFIYIYISIYLS